MPGAAIAAGAIGLVGGVTSGIASKNQADAQADITRQQGASALQNAILNEEDFRRDFSRRAAKSRAASGVSGVRQDTGSPLLVLENITGEAELQALRIRQGGQLTSFRANQQADLTKRAGRSALASGIIRGGTSLLSGIGNVNFGGGGTVSRVGGQGLTSQVIS